MRMKRNFKFLPVAALFVFSNLQVQNSNASTLLSDDTFTTSGTPNGDLIITGDLSIANGIDFGTASTLPAQSAIQLNYFGSSKQLAFDSTDSASAFIWRDGIISTARNKMQLDANNVLSLYNSTGSAVTISLNGDNGRINLNGAGSGIYSGGNAVLTLSAAGSMELAKSINITSTTSSTSNTTGALVISGGIGVAKDSYFNGVRIGRGGGDIWTNMAVGEIALSSNTTGWQNNALGFDAMYSNTTGFYNTAAGAHALRDNTTGSYNAAYGSLTLTKNTTADHNTAVGHSALENATTGGDNTAVGTNALRSATIGGGNSAYGSSALVLNTTGFGNTGMGSAALYGNTTGYNNTALGWNALAGNTTGVGNIGIGINAGRYQSDGTNLTSSNSSIYIGHESRGFSNSDSNSIVIGSNAVGKGPNKTVIGNSSTTETYLFGQLFTSGINITSPSISVDALTIDGNVKISNGTLTVSGSPVLTAASAPFNLASQGFINNSNLSSSLKNLPNLTVGSNNNATGQNAVALGAYTSASGNYSMAVGYSTTASNWRSFATGDWTQAIGTNSFASGSQTVASGVSSFTAGSSTSASGSASFAVGVSTISSGDNSFSAGLGTSSSGYASFSAGYASAAKGPQSFAVGYNTEAIGQSSFVAGSATKANKFASVALGTNTIANSYVETVLGAFNNPIPATFEYGFNPLEGIFEIGNGTSTTDRSNAVTVLKNGKTTLTNKFWNASAPAVIPSDTNASSAIALEVNGHQSVKGNSSVSGDISVTGKTTLQGSTEVNGDSTFNGKVTLSQPQGDISMGIYE